MLRRRFLQFLGLLPAAPLLSKLSDRPLPPAVGGPPISLPPDMGPRYYFLNKATWEAIKEQKERDIWCSMYQGIEVQVFQIP